jgi:hypothetical protein
MRCGGNTTKGTKVTATDSFNGSVVVITATGPARSQLAAYGLDTDQWATADLSEGLDGLWPKRGAGSAALICMTGSNLKHLAVFDLERFRWSIQELAEPLAQGVIDFRDQGDLVVYFKNRHVYAYSGKAGRWDVLRLNSPLPDELGWNNPVVLSDHSVVVSQNGHLHVFAAGSGQWREIVAKD